MNATLCNGKTFNSDLKTIYRLQLYVKDYELKVLKFVSALKIMTNFFFNFLYLTKDEV